MYLNRDFKLVKRNNYIILTAIGILFAIFLALFVTTSWYKNDLAITKEFYKAMDYDFFKGWSGYFVLDGYILVIDILVPVGYILVESLYAYSRKKNHKEITNNKSISLKWLYIIGMIIVPIITWLLLASYCFDDYGFGTGFIYWFIIDWKFIIPIYIVSGLINMAVLYGLLYYVHHDLARRENFLSSGTWQKSIITFIFVLIMYIPVMVMKNGFGRPYLWNIEWDQYDSRIKDFGGPWWQNYHSQTAIRYGFMNNGVEGSFPTGSEWPWWKVARGYFDRHSEYYNSLPKSDAFPSGHMAATSSILVALNWTIFGQAKNKKESIIKWSVLGVSTLYALNLFFSLLMSANHWASDMSFTLMWAPIAFLISYGIDRGISKLVVDKKQSQNIY